MKGLWLALVALLVSTLLGALGCVGASLAFVVGAAGMKASQSLFGSMFLVSGGSFLIAGGVYLAWVLRLKAVLPPSLGGALVGFARVAPWRRLEGALRMAGEAWFGEVADRLRRTRIVGMFAGIALAVAWMTLGKAANAPMNATSSAINIGLSLLWIVLVCTFLQQVRVTGDLVRRVAR